MADVLTKEQRSYNMSRIRASKTKPEFRIKKLMELLGMTYQPKNIYGKPDFANRKERIAVFIDGCFWHGCPNHYSTPKQNRSFWKTKISGNKKRDKEVTKHLSGNGWNVVRLWEHDLK